MTSVSRVSEHRAGVAEPGWRRLSQRVIWVDLVVGVISLAPGLLGAWLAPSAQTVWLLALITLVGVAGAVGDGLRWISTTYRVTDTEVQRRSGIFVRRSRSVRIERIRSVDTYAKLRHRLGGMRVVTIGAGQQTGAREAAVKLDALSRTGAEQLRSELMGIVHAAGGSPSSAEDPATTQDETERWATPESSGHVIARFQLRWVLYNVFTLWAYVMAAGVLWAGGWLLSSFGIDLVGATRGLLEDLDLGVAPAVLITLVVVGAFGAVVLGITFVVSHWHFELVREHTDTGSFLTTRRGLFSTREVNRDEARVRGISIDEPLAWRWMGMADTHVLTTGLSLSSNEEATALVPRGPISVARRVAQDVVGEAYGTGVRLPRHPRAALRRRLVWATGVVAGVVGVVALPVATGLAPVWVLWLALGLWPLALVAAYIAYAVLGHGIRGDYVITRAGLVNRSTSVLRRDAVSTVAVRQSLLQRRLGLSTVAFMTAAGWGAYEVPDVDADRAFAFADEGAAGILEPFLEVRRAGG